jgi:hypothetical protein
MNFYAPDHRSTFERFRDRIFPSQYVEADLAHDWCGHGDVVHVDGRTSLSILDRLRVALTGRLAVRVRVTCENVAGKTVSVMAVWPQTKGQQESDRAY